MKKNNAPQSILYMLSFSIALFFLASCQKDTSAGATTSLATATDIATTEAIAVAASRSSSGDSVYVIGTCEHGHHTDSVSFGSLPPAIPGYLAANYDGYAFQKAFTDEDSSGNVSGYIVIIQYNGNPVGLKFDSSGAFVKVLEQREGRDLYGHGWHEGGQFHDRDGRQKDTVALTSLPANIASYYASTQPGDTLVAAFKNHDSTYVVISKNNGVFATVFDAAGTFIRRVQLPAERGHANAVALSALPAQAQTYLTATYPNYVFKHAFVISLNGVVQGYVVLIDANSTKYAVEFNAGGSFIKALTIR